MATTRAAYHHGDLRNALVVAGRELLAEAGVAALDLRKVARRVGVSHAAPYRHFVDKDELLAAIAEAGFTELTQQIDDEVRAAGDTPAALLVALTRGYVRFVLDNPEHARLMFGGLARNASKYPQLYSASKQPLYIAAAAIAACQQRGLLVDGDPLELTVVAWTQMHGLAMLLVDKLIPLEAMSPEQLAQSMAQHLYHGLAPR